MADFNPLEHETPAEDLEALRQIARSHTSPTVPGIVALEVGSWVGQSTLVLADWFDMVFCVDHWRGTPSDRLGVIGQRHGTHVVFATFCANMGDRLHRSVFPCAGFSQLWAEVWRRPLDLCFIDADHTYLEVTKDICAWRKHVRKGGILCGHDYGVFEGVSRAVDRLVPDRKLAGLSLWWTVIE